MCCELLVTTGASGGRPKARSRAARATTRRRQRWAAPQEEEEEEEEEKTSGAQSGGEMTSTNPGATRCPPGAAARNEQVTTYGQAAETLTGFGGGRDACAERRASVPRIPGKNTPPNRASRSKSTVLLDKCNMQHSNTQGNSRTLSPTPRKLQLRPPQ
ncbi:unnamed protein product [Prorocentrum cordatum]|nr:unnamed protein product [Polarella glacialis]